MKCYYLIPEENYGGTSITSDEEEMVFCNSRKQDYGGTSITSDEEEMVLCNSRR
jgi:hypothetical protein